MGIKYKGVPMFKHYTMKAYKEVEEKSDAFLTSDLEWSAPHSVHFTTSDRAPGIHWTGALVDSVSVWMQCRKILVKVQSPLIHTIANSLTASYPVSQKAGNACIPLKHERHLYNI
jgi:hypothetical protein